jgi:asparagine synthetase B (glutamine-hydrolysing)
LIHLPSDTLNALERRGPDHIDQIIIKETLSTGDASLSSRENIDVELALFSSVLHLRGDNIVAQPYKVTDQGILCWNGEVYGGSEVCEAIQFLWRFTR